MTICTDQQKERGAQAPGIQIYTQERTEVKLIKIHLYFFVLSSLSLFSQCSVDNFVLCEM